ncbi:MAG: YbaB/EbfC family nucleoid-associated protein [Candidatus Paceibacterota bacterium]|nr:MAG: YbaB/EbfC family nucleoid-associated protein [Candidatus Paceibacterota bacterium]
MFDQLKQIMELRKMQEEIKKHVVVVERRGVKLSMRGDFEVTHLALNDQLDARTQSTVVVALLKEAREKIQKELAQKLAGSMSA